MMKFELIRYIQTPEDQYTNAVATLRIDGKHVVAYANKKLKDGGNFWASPSVGVTINGEKKHYQGYMLDSRAEEEMLIDFIKDEIKKYVPMVAGSASLQATGQMVYASTSQPHKGQNEEQLPF